MTTAERGPAGTWRSMGWWSGGQLDLGRTLAWLPADDMAAAHLIDTALWPGELHHASDLGRWHVWDGQCHRPDDSAATDRRVNCYAAWCAEVLQAARQQVTAGVMLANPGVGQQAFSQAVKAAWEPWEACEKYAAGLRRTAGAVALRTRLAGVCGVGEAWLEDRHPEYLNVANGILHLPSGMLYQPHDPRAGITYCLSTPYLPGTDCPWFKALVLRAAGGNQVVAGYLIDVLGYCLVGDNREQKIFFLGGETASGKSQVLDAVSAVLGTLAHSSQNALISVARQGRNARVEWSCAGARLVTITETSGHNTTDEAQVKRLTGESRISVDRHYSKTEVKIKVTFTIVQATNEMQTLTNFDNAIARRVEVLPMGGPVPDEQQVKRLGKIIADREAPGILALLAGAARKYFAAGLHAPAEVMAETARYRAEQNTLEDFLADCAVFSVNGQQAGPGWAGQSAVWRAYMEHAEGGPRLRKHQFFEQLRAHPGVMYNEGSRRFYGIQLSSPVDDHDEPWKPG